MAKGKVAATAPRSWLWLQGAICGGLVVLAPGTALVLGTLLLGAVAMAIIETTPGRPIARSMLLMGAATALSPLLRLWEQGGSLAAAVDVLSNPLVPLWSWVGSGSAWLIGQTWEVISTFIMHTADDHASRRLKEERTKLVDEWRTTT